MAFGLKNKKENTGVPEETAAAAPEAGQPEDGKTAGAGKPGSRAAFPGYEYPGRKPEGGREQRAWRKKVLQQRKLLRSYLKSVNAYSRSNFEQMAWELGLSLDEGRKAGFFAWLKWAFAWLKTGTGMRALIGVGTALLALLFLLSYVTELAGAFTVNLTADMLRSGFILSESRGFDQTGSRLFSEKQEQINNITVDDVDGNVDDKDGSHNGNQYVAYSFYIKNNGQNTASYQYSLNMKESGMGVEKAVWLMLFEDGHQVIYAAPSADGDEERLFGYSRPPFYQSAYDPQNQYYERDGVWGLKTTAFVDEHLVVQGLVKDVEPGDTHKYTVVIWLEGNDPECTDDIFGGFAKYSMDFSVFDEENGRSIFNGVWRTEFDDYAAGRTETEDLSDEKQNYGPAGSVEVSGNKEEFDGEKGEVDINRH